MTMETITWIISVVAIGVFLIGIISTIFVRVETVPNWKRISKVLYWVIGLVIFKLLVWWFMSAYRENKTASLPIANSGVQAVQPAEEWVFHWDLPEGQYGRGQNSATFKARITESSSDLLCFDVYYNSGGATRICRFVLKKAGDRYSGEWYQKIPPDGGNIYLKKITERIWTGQYWDTNQTPYSCTLEQR